MTSGKCDLCEHLLSCLESGAIVVMSASLKSPVLMGISVCMYVRVFHQRQSSVRQLVTSLDSKYSEEGGARLYLSPHLQSVWDTHEMLIELMDDFTVP